MEITKILIDLLIATDLIVRLYGNFVEIKASSRPQLNGEFYEYRCQFKSKVQCFWQKNGKTISINPYKYVEKQDTNQAKDCSIKASLGEATTKFNQQNPLLDCLGVVAATRQEFQSGETALLECACPTVTNCGWKRNNQSVSIVGRYQFTDSRAHSDKVFDCSIRIVKITEHDAGLWECNSKSTDQTLLKSRDVIEFYDVIVDTINSSHLTTSNYPITSNPGHPAFQKPNDTLTDARQKLNDPLTDARQKLNDTVTDAKPVVKQTFVQSTIAKPSTTTTSGSFVKGKISPTPFTQIMDSTEMSSIDKTPVSDASVEEKLKGIEMKMVIVILVFSVTLTTIAVGILIRVLRKRRKTSQTARMSLMGLPTPQTMSSYGSSDYQRENSAYLLNLYGEQPPYIANIARTSIINTDTDSDLYLVPISHQNKKPDTYTDNAAEHVYEEISEIRNNQSADKV